MSNAQKRVSSKVKQKQIQTKMLEDQTKKMQEKLLALRLQVQEQKKMKEASNYESTISRWRKVTNCEAPLKDYAKKVLADRKQALNKFGIDEKKITGSKSFQPALAKIKSQKIEHQQKQGLRIPKIQTEKKSISQTETKEIFHTSHQFKISQAELPVQSIQNNFFKAKINTTELIKQKTLSEFLQENFLQTYEPILKANDINELDDLYHLSRQKMTEMGIKSGHQAKIIKRIKEQLAADKKQSPSPKKVEEETNLREKVSFGYGDGDVNTYQELNHEEQSVKMRKSKQYEDQSQEKYYQEADEEDESQHDEELQDDVVMLTMPNVTEFSIQTSSAGRSAEIQKQTEFNCFQCYRKTMSQAYCSSDGRFFCSELCLQKYLQFMTKTCPECDDKFYKFNGHFEEDLWFCSLKCCPNQQKIEQMFMDWKAKGE